MQYEVFLAIRDMVLFAVSTLSFLLVVSVVLFFSYRQARKKGYRPPAASAVLLVGSSFTLGKWALSQLRHCERAWGLLQTRRTSLRVPRPRRQWWMRRGTSPQI